MGVGDLSASENAPSGAERNARSRPVTVTSLARRYQRLGALAACCVLILLTWLGTTSAIRTHRAEALARVETDAGNEALVFEELLRRQLLAATRRCTSSSWNGSGTPSISTSPPGVLGWWYSLK